MNQQLFCSGLEVASFIVSSGLLKLSWAKISDCYAGFNPNELRNSGFSLRWKFYEEADVNIIVFITSPICTKALLQDSKEMIPSAANQRSVRVFEFLCNSFCIHKAAIALFDDHFDELLQLKYQCGRTAKPLIVTGHSLGGSVASLFTLWLLESLEISKAKRPLCFTFGSPLLGDKGFQQAISEHPAWNSCFLHVAATSKDSIPKLFIAPSHYLNSAIEASKSDHYKPFGTFLLCCENGCTCSDNPEAVSEVLMMFETEDAVNEERMIHVYERIVEQLESVIIRKGLSRKEQIHQQRSNELDNLIKKLEELEMTRMLNKRKVFDPEKKLNDMKVKMAYLEWYKKVAKAKETGYYDFYKNRLAQRDHDITKHKKFLTNNWKAIVAQAEKKPQRQLVPLRPRWLYSGTTCRRMIEPLDIADYYKDGKRNYVTDGRSHHYIMLEQWFKEDEQQSGVSVDTKKQNVDAILTYDSCFWAHVEEARICCKSMEVADIKMEEMESLRQKLKEFEGYVMEQIKKSAVSSEIFLKGSSFMQWWKEYEKLIAADYKSPLTNFMKKSKFLQYAVTVALQMLNMFLVIMAPESNMEDTMTTVDLSELQVFSNKRINVCLTQVNYLLWKQQVVLTIHSLGLEGYLDGSFPVPAKMVRNTAGEQAINPLYLQYVKQDCSLASWLLSTVSANILPQLVGAETTAAIWSAITKLYSTLSTTKIMNLHCRLRSMKKGTQSMQDYTLAIKSTCDLLATCGSPVSDIEHIATILNGLPAEYEPSVAAISASQESLYVDNVVSILIDAESTMEDTSRFPIGINLTRFKNKQVDGSSNHDSHLQDDKHGAARVNSNNNNRFKGRPRYQCQLCGKLGHLVDRCWHRFDQNFKGVLNRSSNLNQASSHVSKPQVNNCSCCSNSPEGVYRPSVLPDMVGELGDLTVSNVENIQVNALTAGGSASYAKWFPDAGATHHVTNSSVNLQHKAAYGGSVSESVEVPVVTPAFNYGVPDNATNNADGSGIVSDGLVDIANDDQGGGHNNVVGSPVHNGVEDSPVGAALQSFSSTDLQMSSSPGCNPVADVPHEAPSNCMGVDTAESANIRQHEVPQSITQQPNVKVVVTVALQMLNNMDFSFF
ncbi:hypothetical protein GQ457_02G011570 [Hibiscus cannabinus]